MSQIKRERPTFATAHSFHQTGTHVRFSPDQAVSDEERKAIAEASFVELTRLLKHEFPRTGNLEYAILKAHLIVEFAISDYIRCMSRVLVDLTELRRFSFAQKLEIAYLMGMGVTDAVLIPSIERLNKIRNQVAHSFILDRALVDEMLRVNSADYADFVVKDDRDRVRRLRGLCNLVVGNISAQVQVHLFHSSETYRIRPADKPSPG